MYAAPRSTSAVILREIRDTENVFNRLISIRLTSQHLLQKTLRKGGRERGSKGEHDSDTEKEPERRRASEGKKSKGEMRGYRGERESK